MKNVEKLAAGAHYAAVSVGDFAHLNEHVLTLSPEIKIPGKVFIGNALQTTGSEISFQQFAPHAETGFLHTHKNHEELYIIAAGKGEFQVDGEIFAVSEGSVIRVSPAGRRSLRNTGESPMVMICVQYKADSFDATDASDGEILADKVEWKEEGQN